MASQTPYMTKDEETYVFELIENNSDEDLYKFYSDYIEKKKNESRKRR